MVKLISCAALLLAPFAPAVGQERPPPDSATPVDPIIVTVTRVPEPEPRVPYSLSLLVGSEIVRADPGLGLSSALATVPGVTSQSRYNAARDESIAIRGFGARAAFGIRGVRIVLDGIPQTLPDGQGQLTNVDLRGIGRIEVLRGAASALYGNAAGGVINLESDPGAVRQVAPHLRAFGGGDGLMAVDVGAAAPVGRGHVTVRGSRTERDGHRAQSRSEIWRGSITATVPVGAATNVRVVAHLADMPVAEDPGALTAAQMAADPTQANPANLAVGAGKDVFQGQLGVSLDHALESGVRVRATGFTVRRTLDNTLSFATIGIDRWAYGTRAVATIAVPSLRGLRFTAGGEAQWQRDDRRNTSPGGTTVTVDQLETVREAGPFLQAQVRPHQRLVVTVGGRLDAVHFAAADRLLADGDDSGSRTMTARSGTVGVTVDAGSGIIPYVSIGTAFEAPTTTELANRPDGSGGFNPDLDPQRATQYEIGVRGRRAVLAFGIALYLTNVRDGLVPFEDPAVAGRRFFRNAGSSRHRGFEANVTLTPIGGVRVAGAFTHASMRFLDFTTADGVFDGHDVPGVPRRFVTGAVAVRRGPLTVDLEARAASSFFVNDANTVRNAGWWTADVRLAVDVTGAGWRFTPYAGVENVFDREYVEAVAVNATRDRFFEPAPGRTLYVGGAVSR